MKHTEIIADDWNKGSDRYYNRIYSNEVLDHFIRDPWWAFPAAVRDMLRKAVPDFRDKRILVPSSGDNGAVFAFHLMGAAVTSADIAGQQLANAKRIADMQGWDVTFKLEDTMRLEQMENDAYDLVYTSNGVHVWIDDLDAMYRNIYRVLKPGGSYVMFETHPFIRPFDTDAADNRQQFEVIKTYGNIGPFGEVPTYTWRIMDMVNAMCGAGLRLQHMEEFHSAQDTFDCWWYETKEEAKADGYQKFDWQKNPFAALPQWIGFCMQKGSE